MASFRVNRISEDVKKELTGVMRSLKDPRINNGLISIVRVEVTNDMSYATVYVSSLDGLEGAKQAVEGFKSAAGYIRREVCAKVKMRRSPEFRFIADDSIEYSAGIFKLLDELNSHPSED